VLLGILIGVRFDASSMAEVRDAAAAAMTSFPLALAVAMAGAASSVFGPRIGDRGILGPLGELGVLAMSGLPHWLDRNYVSGYIEPMDWVEGQPPRTPGLLP
jgi:hypothetical protein